MLICSLQVTLSVLESAQDMGCPLVCENVAYHITNPKFGKNIRLNGNKTVLLAKKNSHWVKIEEEYTLMGVNAIISATGGSLGLFLGLSCYGVVWTFFEWLEAAYNFLRSKTKSVLKVEIPYMHNNIDE